MDNKLHKQTLINTLGNVSYLVAQWLLTVLTTRILGYSAAGVLTLSMSVGTIFLFIQAYGVRGFQSSDIIRQFSPGDYLLTRVITVVSGILICIIYLLFSEYDFELRMTILLFVLFRTSEAVSDVFFGDLQREGRLDIAGYSMLIRGVLTFIVFWLGLRVIHSLNYALLAIVITSALLTIAIDYRFYKIIVPWKTWSKKNINRIMVSCFPLLLSTLLPSIIVAYPRILLERYSGAEILGYYGNISTPAVIISTIVPSILASLMPSYGEMVSRKDFNGIRNLWIKTILFTIGILIICVLGTVVLGKPVLSWIYSDEIVPYIHFLYYILISTTLYAFTMCGASVLTALRKNSLVSVCAVAATVACFITARPLVQMFGIAGAICVLIVAYLFQTILQSEIITNNTK